ncbi:MAG: trypsin-like peptidase domain-containing protein [Holdemania filiformis]
MKKGLILLTALLACWNLVLTVELWQVKKEKAQEQPTQDPQQSTRPVSVVTSDITKIVERSEAKVTGVSVLDETGEDLIASGSGTIYSTTAEAVYIITNQHVIASGGPIHVSFANGEQLPAELVGADLYTDLALLKVIPDFRAEAFDLGDSSLCKKANGSWRSPSMGASRQRDGRRDFLQRPHDFHGCG